MSRDYYDVLGLQESASADDIKQAYRKLSKEWHPDKHKGDKKAEEKFKKINEAYETLNDPKKKQMYDQFGTMGSGSGPGAGFGGFDFSGFTGGGHMNFSDLFEGFFGGRERRSQSREERGDDREISITIAFVEAVSGTNRELRVKKLVACKTCSGSGTESGGRLVVCEKCEGTGQIIRQSQSFFGLIQQSVVCNNCRGSGKVPEHPCKACRGEGRIADDATIKVAVPAGIGDGQSLRIRGDGDAARRGGTPGDLYVRIRVEQDRRFARDGDDINTTVSIGVPDAILGAAIPIETVHGPIQLKIHPGTQSGQIFRIKHKGMPVLNTSRFGDHYVKVNVEIPSRTSREVRQLVEEWKRLS
ncbi:molecular chaperone DnaJ [Candidatus Peregrinibacteria bacterium]|nr:molecular chaperone DnaJ [Candidatus Peregrinibacteria bacterium]